MWLELDDSLSNITSPSNDQCAALEAIALSVFQGRHALFGSTLILEWMLRQNLSQAAKSACLYVKNRKSEIQSIRESIDTMVTIIASDGIFYSRNEKKFTASLSLLQLGEIGSTLLTENLSDAKIYSLAAEHYRIFKRISYPKKISNQGAGGSQIYPEFVNIIHERRGFVLAVTDTDKDHPSSDMNSVSKNCFQFQDIEKWIHLHINLSARELENILPINLLHDAIFSKSENSDLFDRMTLALSISQCAPNHYIFSDLKLGVPGYWADSKYSNLDKSKYWKNGAKKIGFSCNNKICNDANRCECLIVPALGEKIAEKFVTYLEGMSCQQQLLRAQTSSNFEQWLEVGRAVFEWGIALPRSRS